MNLNELKIGDRVGYERTHYGTFMTKGFGVVTKINGHGHIIVQPEEKQNGGEQVPRVFDKYGNERKKIGGCTLRSAESLTRRLAEVKADHAKQKAVRDLLDYIAGRRCGNGRYNIDEDSKNEIKLLAAQL